jgi:hypothetical protein
MNDTITLGGLLSTIVSTKKITINLFDQNDLLIITFILDGYEALEDELEAATVTKIEISNMTTLNITITRE